MLLVVLVLLLVLLPTPSNLNHLALNGNCAEGYHMSVVTGFCLPNCPDSCPNNAGCVAPNVCECSAGYVIDSENNACIALCDKECRRIACKLGYVWTTKSNSCMSICDESYIWDAESARCAHRCKPDVSWDAVTRTCVQKFKVNVHLIDETFGIVALLMAIGCFGNTFRKRRRIQQIEFLHAKNLSDEEYMLDRSHIMVY